MDSAFLGLISALSWGLHDFIAQFAGRKVGYVNAVLGTTLTGLVGLGIVLALTRGLTFPSADGLLYLVVTGAGFALATMWLFAALTLAPISVVTPIVGAYPVLSVLIAVSLGARPTLAAWMAMAAVIVGVLFVARAGRSGSDKTDRKSLSKGLMFAALSNIGFALSIALGQQAALFYDEFEVTFFARFAGLAAVIPFYLRPAARLPVPPRWLIGFAIMGALDVIALSAVVAAGRLPSSEIAIVIASSFGAITVLLGWIVLRERILPSQWLGIAMIFAGAAVLSLF